MINLYLAASNCATNNAGNTGALINGGPLPHTCADDTTIKAIFLIVFAILGAMALFFAVLAGARYALSKGEPENIQKAKNELKYSVMGLVIVSLAAAIVNYVIGRLGQ